MSKLIQSNLPCKSCTSSDAMAEYDNNYYCFSCNTSFFKQNKQSKPFLGNTAKGDANNSRLDNLSFKAVDLPSDAKKWLYLTGITDEQINDYNIKHVHSGTYKARSGADISLGGRLVIPASTFTGGPGSYNLFRAIADEKPKVLTIGPKDLFFSKHKFRASVKQSVVIVEDAISCIRVGEVVPAIALLGTSINHRQLLTLVKRYDNIIVWLDGDDAGKKASEKLYRRLKNFKPNSTFRLVTKEDPKWYSKKQLQAHLRSFIPSVTDN